MRGSRLEIVLRSFTLPLMLAAWERPPERDTHHAMIRLTYVVYAVLSCIRVLLGEAQRLGRF